MRKLIASVVLCLLFAFTPLTVAAEYRVQAEQIQIFMNKAMEEYQIPGASLAVIHNGEIVFQDSWGKMSDGSTVTEDTTFLIGSVSKPLTALAIVMLAEEGTIKLEEPIETYIPWFTYTTDSTASITVRHLLEHTSGIGIYDGMKVTDRTDYDQERAIAQAAAELSGVKLSHAPGEVYEYNSANYLLLGAIIEASSDQPFSHFMNNRIFSPLGMDNTTADYDHAVKQGLVPGYHSWMGRAVEGDGLYDHAGAPYGYITSTSHDLAKFISFMLGGGELISEQSLKQLQAPPEEGRRYSFGWHFPRSGDRYPYHTGATTGYRSEIFIIPEQNLGAVLLTNKYHELEAVSYLSMMEGIRAIMNGQHPELAPLNASTQWIMLGAALILIILSAGSLITLIRKKTINKRPWLSIGTITIFLAAVLIPLFTLSVGVAWRTVGLFLPDIEYLTYMIITILIAHGLITFLLITVKAKKSV